RSTVRSMSCSKPSPLAHSSSISGTGSCRRRRSPTSSRCSGGSEAADGKPISLDQSAPCDRGHRLDGRDALPATAVCLSLRGCARWEAVRVLQGHGAPAPEGDHHPRYGSALGARVVARLGEWGVQGGLVPRQVCLGAGIVRVTWFLCALRTRLCR